MIPPIYTVVTGNSSVTALIGTRFYPAASAPQGVTKPYATYQNISGVPENYINQVPDVDEYGIQVDCFAESYAQVVSLAEAIRDAVEPVAHITAWRGDQRDPETMMYRFSFDVAWHVNR